MDGPDNLIVVEVLTPSGNWSSYPPHKHDESTPHEVPLEEIYYFRIGGEAASVTIGLIPWMAPSTRP